MTSWRMRMLGMNGYPVVTTDFAASFPCVVGCGTRVQDVIQQVMFTFFDLGFLMQARIGATKNIFFLDDRDPKTQGSV